MKRVLVLFIAALILSGCAGRGLLSGAVDGENMLRVRIINGDAAGRYPIFAEAQAGVDEVRIEETKESINDVTIRIHTDKVDVEIIR